MRGRRGALLALVLGVAAFAPLAAQGRPAPSDVPDTLILAPVGAFSSPTYVTAPPATRTGCSLSSKAE